jgi:hypothetical protein
MWNRKLAALAANYASGVLSVVDASSGHPLSVRCAPQMDAAQERFTFAEISPAAATWRGRASLLFHTHDERLEELRQLVITGELVAEPTADGAGDVLTLRVERFVTANGRSDTDRMAHAGTPLHMLQFLLLGRRNARRYLAKRGTPWPAVKTTVPSSER